MNFMDKYQENCDYLRKRFNLDGDISMYEMMNVAIDHIKQNDLKVKDESTKLVVENSQEEKKRGRPKKVNC